MEFGGSRYQRRSQQTSRVLGQLFEKLRGEGFAVSYTMEDFNRQYTKDPFAQLTPEEQREALESLPPERREEVLQALPPEQRLAGLPPEQRLAGLPPEQRLAGLSAEQIEQVRQFLDRLTNRPTTAPRKPRRKK